MIVDIVYCSWNRLEYTKATFALMIANTNWDLVNRLHIFDDGSEDGTQEWLGTIAFRLAENPAIAPITLHPPVGLRSPVALMNQYLEEAEPHVDVFVKLDNDIAVPPGWLDRLASTMAANPELDILGMQAGREKELVDQGIVSGDEMERAARYGWIPAPHIGGVGAMRLSAFRSRPAPAADGRFGFTAWQQAFDADPVGAVAPLVRGWIVPDVACPQLDFLPFEPWAGLSQAYRDAGWQRYRQGTDPREPVWPAYDPANHAWWDWLPSTEGDPSS